MCDLISDRLRGMYKMTVSHPYIETIEKLNLDKARLRFFNANWQVLKNELSKDDLIFIIENMDVNHDKIIEDLENMGNYYTTDEDTGFSD
jgi:hypothetical protein